MTTPKKNSKNAKNWTSIWIKRIWKLFGAFLILGLLFMVSIRIGLFGALPDFAELENPKSKLASEIYSADDVLLGKLFYQEDRTNSKYHDIPEHMINALVATEDARFYKHSGIDGRALIRALVYMGKEGGGSTISQQLALNMFHGRATGKFARIMQKFKEWILAVELEKRYTKKEIIIMYFNTVPWGNSYGIKSAAKRYFNKETQDLTVEESAMLVGMLKGPTLYNPIRNPERALNRRNTVLNQMERYGYLSESECDSIKALPLETDYNFIDHNRGMATYFRSYLDRWLKAWADKYEQATGVKYNIYDDGLKVYTTIDSKLQAYAEEAVASHMKSLQASFYAETKRMRRDPWYLEEPPLRVDKAYITKMIKRTPRYRSLKKQYKSNQDSIDYYLNKPVPMTLFSWDGNVDTVLSPIDSLRYCKQILHTGFMSMEPQTGYIKAWVGGINFEHFKYDHVNKKSNRQVGSTFKPLVYARALDDDKLQPCEVVSTGPVIVEYANDQTWSPKNSSKVDEELTFNQGLAQSVNTVTARAMKRLGRNAAEVVRQTAGKMGIDESKFVPYPTIALGVMDLSVYEMVGAYGTFVNQGVYVEPIFVTRIEDKNGNVLEEFIPKKVEALRAQTAYIICKMLENVTRPGGTGARLRYRYNIPAEASIGGKTGTTQNNSDGWFMGITPNLVSGCWVGAEERAVHFTSTSLGQGANMALPIFAKYMEKVYKDKRYKDLQPFIKPETEFTIELDCEAYENNGRDNANSDPTDLF